MRPVARQGLGQNLHGHFTPELAVGRAPNLAHAALAELTRDAVMADRFWLRSNSRSNAGVAGFLFVGEAMDFLDACPERGHQVIPPPGRRVGRRPLVGLLISLRKESHCAQLRGDEFLHRDGEFNRLAVLDLLDAEKMQLGQLFRYIMLRVSPLLHLLRFILSRRAYSNSYQSN